MMGFMLLTILRFVRAEAADPELSDRRTKASIRPSKIISASATILETSGASVRA
jgi:hypothetical protein